jgi:glycosyltransferase involved in cell wall biosynthesis
VRIAVFDYKTIPNNPTGGCNRRMLSGLCREHDFTVFATEFDNPCAERIRYVRVPAIKRPLALLFLTFHVLAPIWYWAHRLRHQVRFDRLQMVESNLAFGDVSYSHFCHRRFLRDHRSQIAGKGLGPCLRVLFHRLQAGMEPWVYGKVKQIVVPSEGLRRELTAEYPQSVNKITVIANPVDVESMRRPDDFDVAAFRSAHHISSDHVVLVFAALGHYERKGLPQLLDALVECKDQRVTLMVVGGTSNLVEKYRAICRDKKLENRVIFFGMQKDVRPFYWSADAFILPSFYEVFPLVALEAAASALPLLVAPVNGIEEFVVNRRNGILFQPTADAIRAGLDQFLSMDEAARRRMGENAAADVQNYGVGAFVQRWEAFYAA